MGAGILTDTLRFWRAPAWYRRIDAGGHFVAANLETWVAVEVCLTSWVDVCHRHSATLGRQRERAGQQIRCRHRNMKNLNYTQRALLLVNLL